MMPSLHRKRVSDLRVLRSVARCALFIPLFLIALVARPQANHLVISQVYGGGGNASATYLNDYIEIFNPTGTTQSLAGWSVQYTSATGTGNFSTAVTALSGSIAPGQYYLVRQASGGAIGAALPTADATGTINMAAGAGKVILANTTTGVACNGGSTTCSPAQLATIVDLVGFGNANFFEGAGAAPTLSSTNAAFRASGGCTDTNVNSADFTAATPAPRNSSTPLNFCGPTKLTIDAIGNQTVGVPFNVTIRSRNASDVLKNVYVATNIALTSNGNAGAIGGTTTGTIAAGASSTTLSVVLPSSGTGVTITAEVTAGDVLANGTSLGFDVVAAVCGITLGTPSTVCDAVTMGTDTYDLLIPYTGLDAGTTVVNNGASGTVSGDNPAVTTSGTIIISNINEGDAYNVTFTGACSAIPAVSGASPSCVPSCDVVLGTATALCNTFTPGLSDTYNVSIPYTGVQAGLSVVYSGSGTIAGDSPATVTNGTIVITGISEAEGYSVSLSAPCGAQVVSGSAPACTPPPSTTIVINEVDSDTPGTDVAEFVELFGPANESLTGMVLVFYNGSNDLSYYAQDLDGFSLDANGFFVAGNPGVPNVGVTFAPGASGLLQNGADAVALYFGDGSSFPNNTPLTLTGLIDALVYDTDDADDAGLLALLNAGQPQVNENSNTLGATQSMSRVPDGGTQRNTDTYVQQAVTPGATNVPPCGIAPGIATVQCTTFNAGPGNDVYSVSIPYTGVQAGITVVNNSGSGSVGGSDPATTPNGTIVISGITEGQNYSITFTAPCNSFIVSGTTPACEPPPTLVINEVDADQPSTDTGEFIEIKNTGAFGVNLNGLRLLLYNGSVDALYSTTILSNVILAAGDYYVVCYGTNAGAYCDQTGVGGSIQNGNPDGVRLTTADGSTIIDQMSYGALPMITTEGTSGPVEPATAGLGVARLPDGADTNDNSVDFVVNCITPGASNVAADSDNDGTPDCQDVCNGGPEPGTPCDDTLASTGNDVIQANCSCQGVPIDCEGTPGGTEVPGNDCDDQDFTTVDDVWGLDCVCAGVPLDCLGVPGGPAQPGTPCPGDNNAETVFDTFDANCGCVGIPCTSYFTIEFQNDANPGEVSWEIRQQGTNTLVQSGTDDIAAGQTGTAPTCVSDGCYYFRVIDAGGDGMTVGGNGGYILRTVGNPGTRIIDNRNNFGNLAGGPPDVSAIASNGGFCVPFGTTTSAIYTSCDKLDWVTGEYLVCSSVPAVTALWNAGNTPAEAISGYEFQIFNPNGGYIYNRFRSHNVSDGFSPDNATRACHMKINNWAAANQIPANVLMNVRMRTRMNGVNGNWGAVCRFKIDPVRAACPLTKLMDIPGNANLSCNSTRVWGGGNYVHAVPVTGATQYQWRFRIDGESFITIRTTTTYFIQLNWTTLPLQDGKTYQVEVRAFKNGAWCIDTPTPAFCGFAAPCFTPWGDVCSLTIDNTPANGGNQNALDLGAIRQSEGLRLYPNPNRGDQLNVRLDAVEAGVNTVSVDIYDLTGKRVSARTIAVNDGFVNTVLELGDMDNGLYMVNITAGSRTFSERLVIQH